jgi:hypothetical protein
MPRFVLLYHDCPPHFGRASHWDFMLEDGPALLTWALPQLPLQWSLCHEHTVHYFRNCPVASDENSVVAEPLAAHRIDYLHLEGPLSADRGEVKRIDTGTFEIEIDTPRCRQFALNGQLCRGTATFEQRDNDGKQWILTASPPET